MALRIMALPVDKGGCGHYRVRQPLRLLKEHTEHDTYIVEKDSNDMEEIGMALPLVDVFVVRPGIHINETKALFKSILQNISSLKAKWVMDIDDNMELISPYSEHYRESGIVEYYDKHLKKWLWKDGENGFDLKHNRLKVEHNIMSLKEADMVTVTTKRLAEYASQYNKNVVILPNSIDMERWWQLPLKPNKMLRVGWSGGASHYEDWYTIKEPLNKVLREQPFKLIVAGDYFKGIIDSDLQKYVEHYPWIEFPAHSFRMMCLNLDLAIIPLAQLPFNKYKSAIKLFEFASMGVPSVVANVEPYSHVFNHGETALGYDDATSFEKSLSRALQNVNLRKQIGKNARKWTFKHRNAKTNVKLWSEAYERLVG